MQQRLAAGGHGGYDDGGGGNHTPTPSSRSQSSWGLSSQRHGGLNAGGDDDEHSYSQHACMADESEDCGGLELEQRAEAEVQALLRTVDSVLYHGRLDSDAREDPVESDTVLSPGPVRFPHRKVVVSYLDECREWSAAFPHLRVHGAALQSVSARTTSSERGSPPKRARLPVAADLAATEAAASSASHSLAASATPLAPISLTPLVSAAPRCSHPYEEVVEEVLASHDHMEEVFALDVSGEASPYSALTHAPGHTDLLLSTSRRSQELRGCPPLTPERLQQFERRQEQLQQWWTHFLQPTIVAPIVPHVVALIARAYEQRSHPPLVPAAAPFAPEPEEEEEVLFFDGDAAMPNPFSSTPAATASTLPPSTLRLYELLHLDQRGQLKPRRRSHAKQLVPASPEFVRIPMRKSAAFSGGSPGPSSSDSEGSGDSPSRRVRALMDASELDAAADFHGQGEVLLPDDLDLDEDSMCDPLSYHSPSHYSRYSLTHSASRSVSARRHVPRGREHDTPNNPLSRSASRQTFLSTPASTAMAALTRAPDEEVTRGLLASREFKEAPEPLLLRPATANGMMLPPMSASGSRPVSRQVLEVPGRTALPRSPAKKMPFDAAASAANSTLPSTRGPGGGNLTPMPNGARPMSSFNGGGDSGLASATSPRFAPFVRAPVALTLPGSSHGRLAPSATTSNSISSSTPTHTTIQSRRQYLSSADIRRKARTALGGGGVESKLHDLPLAPQPQQHNPAPLHSVTSPNFAHRRLKEEVSRDPPAPLSSLKRAGGSSSASVSRATSAHAKTTVTANLFPSPNGSSGGGSASRYSAHRSSLRGEDMPILASISRGLTSAGANSGSRFSGASPPLGPATQMSDLQLYMRSLSLGPSPSALASATAPLLSFAPVLMASGSGGGAPSNRSRGSSDSSRTHIDSLPGPQRTSPSTSQQRPRSSGASLSSASSVASLAASAAASAQAQVSPSQRAQKPRQTLANGASPSHHVAATPTHAAASSLRQHVASPQPHPQRFGSSARSRPPKATDLPLPSNGASRALPPMSSGPPVGSGSFSSLSLFIPNGLSVISGAASQPATPHGSQQAHANGHAFSHASLATYMAPLSPAPVSAIPSSSANGTKGLRKGLSTGPRASRGIQAQAQPITLVSPPKTKLAVRVPSHSRKAHASPTAAAAALHGGFALVATS